MNGISKQKLHFRDLVTTAQILLFTQETLTEGPLCAQLWAKTTSVVTSSIPSATRVNRKGKIFGDV